MLLIGGGQADPNLQALRQAADGLGVPCVDLCVPPGQSPRFHWSLSVSGQASEDLPLPWGGTEMPTGAFLRQDVFAAMTDPRAAVSERAQGWFASLHGWLLAHPQVRSFNADITATAFNKPAALLQARAAGLRIPHTWVTNDVALLRERLSAPCIAKPVAGGGLCQTLDEALQTIDPTAPVEHSAMPALIQPRLAAAEMRLFVVGQHHFAFDVSSPSLDYRAQQDATVTLTEVPPEVQPLRELMRRMRMEFGAADFKRDPDTGEWVFLELNTSPMFAHFNWASEGALCRAMVQHLVA
jgi:glutathione synthase/RimK-type ligase-like ATP-grasp enzyme